MSPEEHRRLDDATVALCEAGSWKTPRDVLRDCPGCRRPFWAGYRGKRYCSDACKQQHHYHTHADHRARSLARRRADYRRTREAAA